MKPQLTTDVGLLRVLKGFALSLGMADPIADAAARAFLERDHLHARWNDFLSQNCMTCALSVEECAYFNPQPAQCPEGVAPVRILLANILMVEESRHDRCPVKVDHVAP